MVCVSCFVIPIGLWIWFNFIMPILARIKALIWPAKEEPNKQDESSQNKLESSSLETKMKCPFSKKEEVTATPESKKTS